MHFNTVYAIWPFITMLLCRFQHLAAGQWVLESSGYSGTAPPPDHRPWVHLPPEGTVHSGERLSL